MQAKLHILALWFYRSDEMLSLIYVTITRHRARNQMGLVLAQLANVPLASAPPALKLRRQNASNP